jgi:hypothetical protein
MSKYAILIYDDPAYYAKLSPEAWGPGGRRRTARSSRRSPSSVGPLAGGEALAPTTAATTIKTDGTVTDGPFLSTKEAVNGYYVIEARDLDHAREIAKLHAPPPAAASRSARSWTRRRQPVLTLPATSRRVRGRRVAEALADAHRREWAFVLAATVRVAGDLELAAAVRRGDPAGEPARRLKNFSAACRSGARLCDGRVWGRRDWPAIPDGSPT